MTNARALGRLADLYLKLSDKPNHTEDERTVMVAIELCLEAHEAELRAVAAECARRSHFSRDS